MNDLVGADEIIALLARHQPGRTVRDVTAIDEGTDHVVVQVDDDLVVRQSKEPDPATRAAAVQREAALLTLLAGRLPLPIPTPAFTDDAAGVLAYVRLAGSSLHTHPVSDPGRLAAQLGEFVGTLHAVPLDAIGALAPPDPYPMPEWRQDAENDYSGIVAAVPAPSRARIERFLAADPPTEPHVRKLCHHDLGAEHILVDMSAQEVTGVIDWSDAAVADPMVDLARLLRDLGPDVVARILRHYPFVVTDADRERMLFYARCTLIEDIAYGLHTGRAAYVRAGMAHLDWTFG